MIRGLHGYLPSMELSITRISFMKNPDTLAQRYSDTAGELDRHVAPIAPPHINCQTALTPLAAVASQHSIDMSSIDLSKLTAAESPEDREAAATAVAKQVTAKVS